MVCLLLIVDDLIQFKYLHHMKEPLVCLSFLSLKSNHFETFNLLQRSSPYSAPPIFFLQLVKVVDFNLNIQTAICKNQFISSSTKSECALR
jgi:hypothetical protein